MKRAAVHLGLIAAIIFASALSASPALHERFHLDAKQSQHECAVTFITAGNVYHAAPPSLDLAPALILQFSFVQTLRPIWVASPFLSARIFEHAPPANS